VSCAKTAEPIEMQFGMLSRWVQGTSITWDVDAPMHGKGTIGVSGQLKSIVKHRILRVG